MTWLLRTCLTVFLGMLLVAVLVYSLLRKGESAVTGKGSVRPHSAQVLRLGVIPERDIFEQHRRFRSLADEVERRMQIRVELLTASAYQNVLTDLSTGDIDGAFLGSLIAVLAVDQTGAQLVVKTERVDGLSSYRGTVFVRDDSPIQELEDLQGHSLAMVRTTLGGHLFPATELHRRGMLSGERAPRIIYVGTHDEAIRAVIDGNADAAAAKDSRLDAHERDHPAPRLRRLAISQPVPESALVLRPNMDQATADRLRAVLLSLPDDPTGLAVLQTLGARRFVPVQLEDYHVIFDLVDDLADHWGDLGISGPPPRRPAEGRG